MICTVISDHYYGISFSSEISKLDNLMCLKSYLTTAAFSCSIEIVTGQVLTRVIYSHFGRVLYHEGNKINSKNADYLTKNCMKVYKIKILMAS